MRDPLHRLMDRLAARIAYEVHRDLLRPSRREHYGAIAELRRRYGLEGLTTAELKVFSQNGEDGVLAAIFEQIGTTNRYFIEFGVGDGVECNTRFLMEIMGWSGLYLEPDEHGYQLLADRLAARLDVTVRHTAVTPDNVNELLAVAPVEPDLLSIDVDGQDYWIWEACELRARVVVIEYNATLDPSSRLVEPKGTPWTARRSLAYGASEGALVALAKRKGYRLVHAELAGVNLFFVRHDLAAGFRPPMHRGMNIDLEGRRHPSGEGNFVTV